MKRIIVLSIIITLVLSIIFGGVSAEEKNNSESRDFNALNYVQSILESTE
mgnify:CR=1 FL=1